MMFNTSSLLCHVVFFLVYIKGDVHQVAAACHDEYSSFAAQLSETERSNLEAIRTLHIKLDEDANGTIDLSESDKFLREELHYEGGHERRQKTFHRDDDLHISVCELWDIWSRSEVHNWTVDQTTDWLSHFVQLPQYVSQFKRHGVDGTKLPRLAVSSVEYTATVLGIKDSIHRQKIAVKAKDAVLFGSPKDSSNFMKDATLITLLIVALAGAWYTYQSHWHSKQHLTKLMEHLDILSSAEKELQELQVKLQHARQEQDITLSEKQQLEQKLEEEVQGSTSNLYQADPLTELELKRLREEVDILREELRRAEGELENRLCWAPSPELQHWLQLTYELEQRVYNKKRLEAEKQLELAKDACEKMNRKRTSFLASFVSTHERAMDDVDKSILEARSSLMEVKQDLQERTIRWRQIESLCGFYISTNPGLSFLETLLRSGMNSSRFVVFNPSHHGTLDEDADETGSIVSSCTALKQLVSTSTLVFLTSAAGPPVATAAALQLYSDGWNNSAIKPFYGKFPFLKSDSNISLESASALINSSGNGLSSHSVSLSELPKTTSVPASTDVVIRQRLTQRENSKDSAFDGSTVSVGTQGEEDNDISARPSGLSTNVSMKPITALPNTKLEYQTSRETIQNSPTENEPLSSDKTTSLAVSQTADGLCKSPVVVATKLNTRLSKLKKKQRFQFPSFVKRVKSKN